MENNEITSLFKKILSIGDLVDSLLINNIKLRKIKNISEKDRDSLHTKNQTIISIMKLFDIDINDELLKDLMNEFTAVLEEQWNILDKVHDLNLSESERGKYAMLAQQVNISRVSIKNKINELWNFDKEVKSYGN